MEYAQGDGSQHVNYIGNDEHVHELYKESASPDMAEKRGVASVGDGGNSLSTECGKPGRPSPAYYLY